MFSETGLLRDTITLKNVGELGERLASVDSQFDSGAFVACLRVGWDQTGLAERVRLVRDALYQHLPQDFAKAVAILLRALPPEMEKADLDGLDLTSIYGFINIPQTAYVAHYGQLHFELAMQALYEMTKRFSAEGAIRSFLKAKPRQTLAVMARWVQDENPHVRRLVSEGTRPRLPMSMRLHAFIQDPSPIFPLLEQLKDDPTLFVRRSVANNWNDIAKDHPDLVAQTLKAWAVGAGKERQWLIRHALRTLEKQGHPKALAVLGYATDAKIEVLQFEVGPDPVHFGGEVTLKLHLRSVDRKAQKLVIDYMVFHTKANGQLKPKVFKLARKMLAPGLEISLMKRHAFRPISTRKYYDGPHEFHLTVNGQVLAKATVQLNGCD